MTKANATTTTRRRQRRHATQAEELAAMVTPHEHVALDRCPGLPGIAMHGAHVWRHDADGETLCTRCDIALPPGLCLACGATLYVSGAYGDLRDASNGEARCTGRLMRSDDQPAFPYAGTAHSLRKDDPLAEQVKAPTPVKSGPNKGKVPPTPDRDERRPNGIVCVSCRRLVYVGEGHAPDCSLKARSIVRNAELHERLLRADAIAEAVRQQKAERREQERQAGDDDDDGTERPARTRAPRAPRERTAGGIADDDLCSGSSETVQGEVTPAKTVGVAVCHVCGRRVPVSKDGTTLARHRLNRGKGTRTPKAPPEVVEQEEAPAKATPKAKAPKRNGRSALSAKAVVHALVKGAPACGAHIANLAKTTDAVSCAKCVQAR